MTLRSSLALAAVMATTSLAASGPQDGRLWFKDEIDLDAILAGDFPERLHSHDLITFAAYLQLAGQFEERHRSLFQPEQPSADGTRSDIHEIWSKSEGFWQDILEAAGDATSILYLRTFKYVEREHVRKHANGDIRTYTVSQFVHNCLEDAFRTAHRTLADRRARYGPGSVELSRWLDAQVKVFDQCDGEAPFEPPEEPGPDWQPLAQHGRRYQIAAAYFYNGQYLEAAARFDKIARTPDSPWRDLGRYLVPRSLAREAIVNDNDRDRNLTLALEAYRELADDPDFVDDFPSVLGQIRHVEAQRDPYRLGSAAHWNGGSGTNPTTRRRKTWRTSGTSTCAVAPGRSTKRPPATSAGGSFS